MAFISERWFSSLALVAITLLPACSALEGDAYQLETLQVGPAFERGPKDGELQALRGVSVDAKQRFVWSPRIPVRTYVKQEGSNELAGGIERRAIVCAEPSPDALSAIANAFDTELSGNAADGTGVSAAAAARISASLSETAQTIGERTQTIQLLRDAFYRACESYANGAIDDFGYSLILGQIDLFMIQLLAVDALGRSQGGAAVAEKQALLDVENTALAEARNRLATALSEKTRFEAQSRAGSQQDGASEGLVGKKAGLETRRDQINEELASLDGGASEAGSVEQARKTLTDTVNAEPEPSAAEVQVLQDELAFRRSRRDALRSEKVRVESDLGTTQAQIDSLPQDVDPTGDINKIESEISSARSAVTSALTKVASAEAAVASARGGVGPAATQAGALTEIVKQTFQTGGNPLAGRAARVACLQWFARNPNIRAPKPASAPAIAGNAGRAGSIPQNASDLPAIAIYCDRIIQTSFEPADEGGRVLESVLGSEPRPSAIPTPLIYGAPDSR